MLLFEQIVNNATEGIIVCDNKFNLLLCNPAMEVITGLKCANFKGVNVLDKFPVLKRMGIDAMLKRALKGETVKVDCMPYKRPVTSQKRWLKASFVPSYNQEKSIIGVMCFIKDITHWKELNEEFVLLNNELGEKNEDFGIVNERLLEARREIQQMAEQLKVARESAVEGEKLKTTFLENLSHEIRTPMNAIVGFSKLLEDKLGSQNPDKEYTRLISQQSFVLLDIIDELLEMSSIELGQVKLKPEVCNLDNLFDYLFIFVDKYKIRQGKANVKLTISRQEPYGGMEILTDRVKLMHVLKHLLENAVKFTEKGNIEFGIYNIESDVVSFFVSDTGIGVSDDHKDIIFDKFRQGTSTVCSREGLGLGLSIVRGLAELLGGKVWFKSSLKHGTTFYFSVKRNLSVQIEKKETFPKVETIQNQRDKTVLVVDNNIGLVEYFKEVFALTGIKLLIFCTWEDAIDVLLSDISIDLILADVDLLDLAGQQFVKGIRMFRPNVPVIAQTIGSRKIHKVKQQKTDYDDFIAMPVLPNKLLSIVYNHFSNTEVKKSENKVAPKYLRF
jgi:PAS domain S-box-containing protein